MKEGYLWKDTLLIGRSGENRAVDYLSKRGCKVMDKTADRAYQLMGIDLVVDQPSGVRALVEVKTDTHTTGNVYLEVMSNLTKQKPGCILVSEADYLWYFFSKLGQVLIIPVRPLQDWMKARLKDFVPVSPTSGEGEFSFRSLGYPVPRSVLLNEIPGCKQLTIKEAA